MSLNPEAMVFVPGRGMVKASEAGGAPMPAMPRLSPIVKDAAAAAPSASTTAATTTTTAAASLASTAPASVASTGASDATPTTATAATTTATTVTPAASSNAAPAPKAAAESRSASTGGGKKVAAVSVDDDGEGGIPVDEALKDDSREHLNIVFVGHVDAGKSTTAGQVLVSTGMVDQRTIEKYTREAEEKKHASWYLAYILDTNEEERARGKTQEVGRACFETKLKRYTILDAPGHRNYLPLMIAGAAQADVAVLVISARKGEFEAGLAGQTKEHLMLIKTLGVTQIIVLVNKMDDVTVAWSKERYDECVKWATTYAKTLGFTAGKDLHFIPASGLNNINICKRANDQDCPWYTEKMTLLERLDSLPKVERSASAPLRVPLLDGYKERGNTIVMGKIEQGTLERGSMHIVMPNKTPVEVIAVYCDDAPFGRALPGENVKVILKGLDDASVKQGSVLCAADAPVPCVNKFVATIQIVELLETKPILARGYNAMIHIHCTVEEVQFVRLLAEVDRKTGKDSKKDPPYLKSGSVARVILKTTGAVCLEKFVDSPQLGRFTIRDEGKTIAIGKVTAIEKPDGKKD